MNRDALIILTALALAVFAPFMASRLADPINERRAELELTVTEDPSENLPPEIAFTTAALGSFRGLLVDFLWYRANTLQNEGKFYEAIQLSDWITKLQPRFPQVWAFHAWNMSYNISEAVHTPQEKWMWVNEGVRLLRDKAIPMNPNSVTLYRELSYILFHKIGKYAVGTHWYYKREFAEEWQALLGEPPGGPGSAAIQAMQQIVDAPDTLAALTANDPSLRKKLEQLQKMGFEPDLEWLRRVHIIQATERWAPANVPEGPTEALDPNLQLLAWLRDAGITKQRAALLAFARKRTLKNDYHMEPETMLALMKDFGPLDWRHPAAHTVYWAAKGARISDTRKGADLFEVLQTDRNLLQSLHTLSFSGRIHYDPMTRYYSQVSDPRLFDGYEKALTEVSRRQGSEGEVPRALKESHRGFLEWATRESILYGSRKQAERYYTSLRDTYGERIDEDGRKTGYDYTMPLSAFVSSQLTGGEHRIEPVRGAINALLRRAFAEQFAANQKDRAKRTQGMARQLYTQFQKKSPKPEPGERKALQLPPFSEMLADAFADFLSSPAGAVPPMVKVRVWQRAPIKYRQAVYDRVRKVLHQTARRLQFDPLVVFPEPPGMEEYRKKRGVKPRQEEDGGAKVERN